MGSQNSGFQITEMLLLLGQIGDVQRQSREAVAESVFIAKGDLKQVM